MEKVALRGPATVEVKSKVEVSVSAAVFFFLNNEVARLPHSELYSSTTLLDKRSYGSNSDSSLSL